MVMRSTAMDLLNLLVGDWQVAMHEAWFLDQPDVDDAGTASIEWLGDAFLSFHWRAPVGDTRLVIGRSDRRSLPGAVPRRTRHQPGLRDDL